MNSQNTLGIDFTKVDQIPLHKTGTTALGENGRMYVYAKAGATIADDNAVANITLSSGEYVAAASGGTWNANGTALAAGDFAWFFKDITGT